MMMDPTVSATKLLMDPSHLSEFAIAIRQDRMKHFILHNYLNMLVLVGIRILQKKIDYIVDSVKQSDNLVR